MFIAAVDPPGIIAFRYDRYNLEASRDEGQQFASIVAIEFSMRKPRKVTFLISAINRSTLPTDPSPLSFRSDVLAGM
jgi:hypothetical protein